MMIRPAIVTILIYCFAIINGLYAQLDMYGQISPSYAQSSKGTSQVTFNEGRPTFLWRLDLFGDAYITDKITAYATVRSQQDQLLNIDYLAIRITDISPLGFNLQAGKFDMPFGNLYSRRFPADNFLYDLPLMYQYHTVVMSNYIHPGASAMLQRRGEGGSPGLPSSMPILDRGIYGTGVMVFGSVGIIDYFAALMNGTVGNTGSYGNSLNVNNDLGKLFRITMTPLFGLTIGGSVSWGSYLSDSIEYYFPDNSSAEDYRQFTGSIDIEYTRGHFQFFSQALYNTWEYPTITDDLHVFGYYAESKYTFRPRWFIAARVNQLLFSNINVDGTKQRWDHNVLRVEGGIGFAIDRNTLAKAVYKETTIYGHERNSNSMFALQLVTSF